MKYDLAVIGGGSAGLVAAAAAAQFGQKVVLFERDAMGGECLNTGCVPSKALLAAAKAAQSHRDSDAFGVSGHEPAVDFSAVMAHVERAIATLAPHDSHERFESLGVKVVRASAKFVSAQTIEAGGATYEARRTIVATGSRAAVPAIPGLESIPFFTNETIFRNRVLPSHLIIVGGGPVGLEMAQGYRRLGAQVTVIEAAVPLAKDDPELAAVVLDHLRSEGVTVLAGSKISDVLRTPAGIRVETAAGDRVVGSHVLVAAGRAPNIEGLNLEAAGVAYTRQGITVDEKMRSTNRLIYAAGDVAGGARFTHVGSYHAALIIRHVLFRLPVKDRPETMPWVTYTDPELAHVGLAEKDARAEHGDRIRVLRAEFKGNDRAVAEGKTDGLVKVVTLKNGRIVGASIVGPNAGEQIAMWSLAVSRGLKISAIASLVLPYPTMAEAGKRAAVSYYGNLGKKVLLRGLIGFLKLFG
ncbi:MAG: FAD-dependent oxidoreductase [Proteobacteria bacterium]|nr:FAD-dependent oxidoreductase [Pseudomonadota bacterium]